MALLTLIERMDTLYGPGRSALKFYFNFVPYVARLPREITAVNEKKTRSGKTYKTFENIEEDL
jgi:hypothetical protein